MAHRRIGVIGAGAWGTAFSLYLARKGYEVLLWAFEEELCGHMRRNRENAFYLPGFYLPESVDVTNSLSDVLDFSEEVVCALPSFAVRQTLSPFSGFLSRKRILVLTKGLEAGTFMRMSEVFYDITGKGASVCVLSGPSFAKEVAEGRFTAAVIASRERELSEHFQRLIHSDRFRVYTCGDVPGVELGGALKNVMAIGAGIIEGLGLGMNTLAAYVSRCLSEMKRLGRAMGALDSTFMGLSGVGDLVLTCFGPLSRNRAFGMELAKGRSVREILSARHVFEGYYTLECAFLLAKRFQVDMPIVKELYLIVYEGKDVGSSVKEIERRAFKEED
jgi:glycerol-3-phosphate dehydrogenase (NAD(P)+)